LRFVPLQRTSAASRCPRQPAIGRSRFGVSSPARAPMREPQSVGGVRPCGFSLSARSNRRRSIGRTFGVGHAVRIVGAAWTRRLNESFRRESRRLRSAGQVESVKPLRTLSTDPACRALPLRSRSPARVMHRRVLWRGVPLPVAGHSRPSPARSIFPLTGRFSFPREFSPGGAPGVLPSAGLVPQSGGQVAQVRPLNE